MKSEEEEVEENSSAMETTQRLPSYLPPGQGQNSHLMKLLWFQRRMIRDVRETSGNACALGSCLVCLAVVPALAITTIILSPPLLLHLI